MQYGFSFQPYVPDGLLIVPLNCRGGCYFCLDTKVTKTEQSEIMNTYIKKLLVNTIKTEKSFGAAGHTPCPLFCQAFALRVYSYLR